MTDPITRARKEWCDPWLVEFDADDNEIPVTYDPCPPEVIAALLDVLKEARQTHGGRSGDPECNECVAVDAAEAAITRALEGES